MTARPRRDAGVVGFMAILPLTLITVLLGWEAFLIGMASTYASHAANEGARQAAVGGDYPAVRQAALKRIGGLWADPHNVTVRYPAHPCPGHLPPDPVPYDTDCGYVRVTIRPPALFPWLHLPMTITSRTRIIYEGP